MTTAKAILHELELIRKRHRGILRPADVVKFARDPKTALHKQFEWDDSRAAEQYRLEQARHIIRCAVRVVVDDKPPIRAYVSLVSDRQVGDSYRDIIEVMCTPTLRERLLKQALNEADSWRLRYEQFVELQAICREIVKARQKHATRRTG